MIMKNQDEALKKLRTIILQDDQERVAELKKELLELRKRVNDADEWLEKLDPVLADALSPPRPVGVAPAIA